MDETHVRRCLYRHSRCQIIVQGASFDGFELTAGVRQGCPLSPLLFAVLSDVLLRRLPRLVPESNQRAYADDLAVALAHSTRDAPILERAFDEYERLSGLWLQRGKSVWVPLSLTPVDIVRARLQAAAPTWGEFTVRRHATYLGFEVGPERAQSSWTKPLQKYISRARRWRAVGGGMLITILAYRVYIFPVLCFLMQLDRLPPDWAEYEQKACALLFPGPRCWASPAA